MSEEHVILQGFEMVKQFEFFEEDIKQPSASYRVRLVNWLLKSSEVAVLQRYSAFSRISKQDHEY